MKTSYRSKTGIFPMWATLVPCAYIVVIFLSRLISSEWDQSMVLLGIATAFSVIAFVCLIILFLGITYTFTDTCLEIRYARKRVDIPYEKVVDISFVERSNACLGLAQEQLRITYEADGGQAQVVISPVKKVEFAEALSKRAGFAIKN